MKTKANVKFKVGGEITWVSKSGKTGIRRRVSNGSILSNVIVSKSDDLDGIYDIQDGNWTVFGISKLFVFNKKEA
jgi:hypothetical protein